MTAVYKKGREVRAVPPDDNRKQVREPSECPSAFTVLRNALGIRHRVD